MFRFRPRSASNHVLRTLCFTEIGELVNREDRDFVQNCDETHRKLYPNGVLTWAEKGSQNVAILVIGDEQNAITVMVTVTVGSKSSPCTF
jgi:hypothetical protein